MSEPGIRLDGRPRAPESTVVTVGTFDGVHRGHQAVLSKLIAEARAQARTSLVVTFDPHPLRVVRPDAAPRLLCTTREKESLLQASGVDEIAIVPFTQALAGHTPREFVERVLLRHFGLAHLVIGYDHGFGKDRSGDAATLQSIGQELGYGVTVVPHTDLDARPISSTRIRLLLSDGDVVDAARALGRPYAIEGTVVTGDRRGRELGFPTANLAGIEAEKLLPAEGIYAVQVQIDAEPARRPAVLHLGARPTFPGARPTIEAFLLDFDGDLYGRALRVHFLARIRGIRSFDSADALIALMKDDVAAARAVLQRVE
jgi:riboflavin kinase / FMN adenylyltransferase